MERKDFELAFKKDEFFKYKILFRYVLMQAARDAFLNGTIKLTRTDRDRALDFFKGGNDLRMVCDIAEVSYGYLVDQLRKSKTNNEKYKLVIGLIKKL